MPLPVQYEVEISKVYSSGALDVGLDLAVSGDFPYYLEILKSRDPLGMYVAVRRVYGAGGEPQ